MSEAGDLQRLPDRQHARDAEARAQASRRQIGDDAGDS